ncbi:hypothetical protein [Roseibacillus persicicus]|uniref:Uncharacterized protein n=1 Tax=Roseibacillus persicicus TaxID=454148 RepID=A0A918TLC0_9BACT|nr:hypothetical protein GCM10007100_17910 [Roseibacillus persicicus]
MSEQVYNCGTIEISTARHTGRQTTVGVFAVNAENHDFHFHLRKISRAELSELDDATFNSLSATLSNWMANLKKESNTPIETLASPRGGLIQFTPRGSFLVSTQNPTWFADIVAEYLGRSHALSQEATSR